MTIELKYESDLDYPVYGSVRGGKLLFRGRDVHGRWVDREIENFVPPLYIETKKDQGIRGLAGESLKRVDFEDLYGRSTWIREMKDIGVRVHGDIGVDVQFFRALPKKNPVLPGDLKGIIYDIETEVIDGQNIRDMVEEVNCPITLISTYDTESRACHLFMYHQYNAEEVKSFEDDIARKYPVEYHVYGSESEMLLGFMTYYRAINPHYLSGWNTSGFDNVYIYRRIEKLIGTKTARGLSPFGIVKERSIEIYGKQQPRIDFVGVADYDYMEIYKQYTYHSIANYRLDTVAAHELGVNKLHHDGSFTDFYRNHWNKFIAYNIRDTLLVKEINDATDLLSVAVSVAQVCGVNLQETFGTVKKLDALTYQYVSDRGLIVPPNKRNESESFPGGFVADPLIGRHHAVISVDAASLYPSMIRESNISPETQVPYESLPEDIQALMDTITVEKAFRDEIDYSCLSGTPYLVTPAGVCYDQTRQGIVPEIMESLYVGRKQAKKRSQDHKKNCLKAKEEIERRGLSIH